MSITVAVSLLIVIPVAAAIKRKFWITLGLSFYGILAYIPGFILPGMTDKISGSGARLTSVIYASCLKGLYGVVNAPFASLSKLLGDNMALSLSKRIMPFALLSYAIVQLYRFYRDAYIRDKLSAKQVDPSIERGEPTRAAEPEDKDVLGTVVLAPAGQSEPKKETKEKVTLPKGEGETRALPKVNKEDVILLGAPSKSQTKALKEDTSSETRPIKKVTEDDVIKLGPPPKPVEELKPKNEASFFEAPRKEVPKTPDVINLGPPPTLKEEQPKVVTDSAETAAMNKMFEEFIQNYESQTKKKIDDAQKQQLYIKFVELYKNQNNKKK